MAEGFGPLILTPKQERETKLLRNSVLKHFEHLEDPRADRGRNHSLVSLIAIAILAVLAGADGFAAIEAYGQAKQSWLETFLALPNGIPSHGDYVFALKGNQGKLFQQVEGWFEQAITQNWQGIEYSYYEKVESGHHRLETRQIWAVPVHQLPPLHRQSLWSGLSTVVMIRSTRQLWNKTTTEVRFFISSLSADAQKHATVIRSHWSIENSLHWVLDVTFNEDASRIRLGYGAENIGLLCRLSVKSVEARALTNEPEDEAL